MNLYLLQYNNYYNRILKRENTLEDYLVLSPYPIDIIGIKNFNYADGISTQQIVNYNLDATEYGYPDYAVAVDEYNNIIGRYYIVDMVYTRKGQYLATLYRDLLADYYIELLNAPMFVEKGALPVDGTDPFIFNKEDMTFNQIKTKEELLQDSCKIPWLIGYMPADRTDITFAFQSEKKGFDEEYDSLGQYLDIIGVGAGGSVRYLTKHRYLWRGNVYPQATVTKKFVLACNELGKQFVNIANTAYGYLAQSGTSNSSLGIYNPSDSDLSLIYKTITDELGGPGAYETAKLSLQTSLGWAGEEAYNDLRKENGKIIYIPSSNSYYKIKIELNAAVEEISFGIGTPMFNKLATLTTKILPTTAFQLPLNETYNSVTFGAIITSESATLTIEALGSIPEDEAQITIPKTKNHLTDAPYAMFAIPYADNVLFTSGLTTYTHINKETSMQFVNSLSKALSGSNFLYDVQLLPYCPFPQLILEEKIINISNLRADYDYIFIPEVEGSPLRGLMMLWCKNSTFSFNIEKTIPNPFGENFKLWNELNTYRLCSPNYASVFEFSAAKNNGVFGFNVDCTYKPFSPYIHINPWFAGLYGNDYNDARGLICGGDFSVTQLNDAWENYERTNVNYEKSFQRTIENMEINNKYQKTSEIVDAITGTVSGGMSAGMAGLLMGGPVGGAIGAAVGGTLSAAGGIADVTINEKLRQEALDYTKDQFGYTLGNIQALPTTIAKLSTFSANNKIYPVLETYSATEKEKEALENKIKYNGMTVMRIGTLNEFISYKSDTTTNYIKGKLIRLELTGDKTEDFHVINQISAELNKGVFI